MIRRLSARELKIFIVSLFLASGYTGYTFLVKPAKERFAALDEEIMGQQHRLAKTSAEIKKAGEMEKGLEIYEQKFIDDHR